MTPALTCQYICRRHFGHQCIDSRSHTHQSKSGPAGIVRSCTHKPLNQKEIFDVRTQFLEKEEKEDI